MFILKHLTLTFFSLKSLTFKTTWSRVRAVTTVLNLKPLNSKISKLMKDGFVAEAQKLFDGMSQRNTVTWNAMISGFFRNGSLRKALQLYDQTPERDIFSYNTVIGGLMKFGDVDGAEKVFAHMEHQDVVTWNSMVAGYIQNGFFDEALQVFHMMPLKDVTSWNLVLSGLVNMHDMDRAEDLFRAMSEKDVYSWTIMISSLAGEGRIVEARKCFDDMPVKDIQAWNTIISGYIKCGCIGVALVLFQKMPKRDWSSWNVMVKGLLSNHRVNDAVCLFHEMPQKCHRVWNDIVLAIISGGLIRECHAVIEKSPYQDIVSWTNMIVAYFGIGEVVNAITLFKLMPTLDTIAWNVTISGLGENDHGEDGLKLFIRMNKGNISPDEATYTSVLSICSKLPTLDIGKQVHAQVIKSGVNCFVSVSNATLTMYARCGNLDFALLEFFSMSNHDIISWNSIICGLACHGHAEKALEMFEQMRLTNLKPNHITFVGVLSACSHAGLVEQGKHYFDVMKREYFIKPTSEHYTCIIDLLGRFGFICEAIDVLDNMAVDGIEIPASVWGALLGACRMYKEFDVGKMAGKRMLELEPWNTGVYTILAEIFLHSGYREEAEKILVLMRDRGMKKQPGCSWIEVKNSGHVFYAMENSHPEFRSICFVLDLMHMEMEMSSFKASTVILV